MIKCVCSWTFNVLNFKTSSVFMLIGRSVNCIKKGSVEKNISPRSSPVSDAPPLPSPVISFALVCGSPADPVPPDALRPPSVTRPLLCAGVSSLHLTTALPHPSRPFSGGRNLHRKCVRLTDMTDLFTEIREDWWRHVLLELVNIYMFMFISSFRSINWYVEGTEEAKNWINESFSHWHRLQK